MAGYLVPPTKNPGDVLTSALWNSYIRDNLDFGMVRPIADQLLVGSAASVDFTSIPATFAHLLVVAYTRGDSAVTFQGLSYRFNNDSAANYDYQIQSGQAAVNAAAETFAATALALGGNIGASGGANLFAQNSLLIAHYAGAANNKACDGCTAMKAGTTTGLMITQRGAGFWRSNAAINRITVFPAAGNLVAGSRVILYGMGGI